MNCKKNNILVFDTETSGLFNKFEAPYITQFSYVVYNTKTHEIVKVFNEYIKIPENVVISSFITNLTGVTRELLDEKGVPINYALTEFLKDFHNCSKIISHNIIFDSKMVHCEMKRMNTDPDVEIEDIFSEAYLARNEIESFCTMLSSVNLCKIRYNETSMRYKWPKLSELHSHLFRCVPDNLHNSMIDVLVCLRCYLKMNERYVITSRYLDKMIKHSMEDGVSV